MNRTTKSTVAAFLVFATLAIPASTSGQVTSNVVRRVLMVKVGDSTGTAFTLDVDKKQYLVTAKHVVSGLKDRDTIQVRRGDNWVSIPVQVFRCNDPIDVAVLAPNEQITASYPLEPEPGGVLLGQEVYFVGFPLGVQFSSFGSQGIETGIGYPMPFPKRATLSAEQRVANENGFMIYLDGYNNLGFSGAPIVEHHWNTPTVFFVIGIVTAFRPEFDPVMEPKDLAPNEDVSNVEAWRIVMLPNGHRAKMVDTGKYIASNTGIVIGINIGPALDLIKQHPVGGAVTQQEFPY